MAYADDNGNIYVNGKIAYNVVDDAKTGRTNLAKKEILRQKEQKIEKETKHWVDERFEKMLNINNLCNKCGQPSEITSVIGVAKTQNTKSRKIFDFNLCEQCLFLFDKTIENWFFNHKNNYEAKKYVKKQIEVEAIQYVGSNASEILRFTNRTAETNTCYDYLSLQTLEGVMKITVGDWVIKGIKGEFYPVRDDIFEETYSEVI